MHDATSLLQVKVLAAGTVEGSNARVCARDIVYVIAAFAEQLGIDPERLRLEWISAAEGEKFAKTIREMTEDLKKLGPSPVVKSLRKAD